MLETIFLTGSSGLIGNKCLLRALHNGCKVIASVRSEEKADAVRRTVKSEADSRNLELVIIPDMTISGVFDRIVASVDYVVHVASPLWTVTDFSDMNKALVEPAYRGTINIFDAARKAPSVKKVVSCSSLGAIVTPAKSFGDETDDVTYTPEHRVPDSYYSSMSETVPEYYSRGKTFALNATDRLAQDELHFDLINIFPSSVIGRSEIANTTKELLSTSNYRGLAIALGRKEQPVPTACVHADDLAKMHIDVLKFDTPKYSNFGGGIQMSFQDQTNIIREHFPQEVANGTFSMDGELPDRPFIFDCSSTEQFFNWKFKSFEEQVKDVAEQYLELLEKEKSK